MFFNYDSIEIVAIAFVVAGIFISSFCNSSPTSNNESLVNTMPTSLIFRLEGPSNSESLPNFK